MLNISFQMKFVGELSKISRSIFTRAASEHKKKFIRRRHTKRKIRMFSNILHVQEFDFNFLQIKAIFF